MSSFVIPECRLLRTKTIKRVHEEFLTFPSKTCFTKTVPIIFLSEQLLVLDINMSAGTTWTALWILLIAIKPKSLPAISLSWSAGVRCHRRLIHSRLLSIASTLSFFAAITSYHCTRQRFTYFEELIPTTHPYGWQRKSWSLFDCIQKRGQSFATPDERDFCSFTLNRNILLILYNNCIKATLVSVVEHFWSNDSLPRL